MSVALHGNLRDFGIGEVFQLIGQQRKTGVLRVEGRREEVELRFDEGRIVTAAPVREREEAALGEMTVRCGLLTQDQLAGVERRCDDAASLAAALVEAGALTRDEVREAEDLLTRETLFELLCWVEGSFHFRSEPIRHEREPETLLGAEQVLMDGLRMVDEWRALGARIPAATQVYARRRRLEDFRTACDAGEVPGGPDAERIFLWVDGRAPLRRLVDLSRLGSFAGVRALLALEQEGWIEAVEADACAPGPDLDALGGPGLGSWVAAVAPVLLLALVVAGLLASPRPASTIPASPFAPPDLRDARLAFELQRLRNGAAAFELARGRSPESLDEVRRWLGDPPTALTDSEPAAYYFASREGGPVVLLPDRTGLENGL